MSLDREQAKVILACLHSGEDLSGTDPEVSEALALLEHDAELREWFEKEQEFDDIISAKVSEVEIPDGLREELLAKMSTGTPKPGRRLITLRRIGYASAALAAALVAVVGVVFYKLSQPYDFQRVKTSQDYAAFRHDMSGYANSFFMLQHTDENFAALNNWLKSKQGPTYSRLPDNILSLESVGCSVLNWGGQNASLLCFIDDKKELIHIFMIPADGLTGLPTPAELASPVIENGLEVAGWTDEKGMVYMLCGSEPGVSINHLVPDTTVALTER